MSKKYVEYDRYAIARLEYRKFNVGEPAKFDNINGKKETIGTVREVIQDETGLNAYVVESDDGKNVSVLYQGSAELNQPTGIEDWVYNDIPMGIGILTGGKGATSQLQSASENLNRILEDYPDAQITVYGHSLGSMNAQYALANVSDIARIDSAYIYQGPNIYGTLTQEQKSKVGAMKYRIHNYIDSKDVIAMAYPKDLNGPFPGGLTSYSAVGIVHHVDGQWADGDLIIAQHMWGGYQWNEDGSLKLKHADKSSIFYSNYSQGLDIATSGFYDYKLTKKNLSTNGYSKSEKIFLDAEQARILAASLSTTAASGTELIKAEVDTVKEKASTTYNSRESYARNSGISFLSSDEILAAFDKAGADSTYFITDTATEFDAIYSDATSIQDKYEELKKTITTGIDDMLAKDSTLAGEFSTWTNLN